MHAGLGRFLVPPEALPEQLVFHSWGSLQPRSRPIQGSHCLQIYSEGIAIVATPARPRQGRGEGSTQGHKR